MEKFTNDLIGLINDMGAVKTKIDKLKSDVKNESSFYFDEMALNVAKVEQALSEVFNLQKPKTKKK